MNPPNLSNFSIIMAAHHIHPMNPSLNYWKYIFKSPVVIVHESHGFSKKIEKDFSMYPFSFMISDYISFDISTELSSIIGKLSIPICNFDAKKRFWNPWKLSMFFMY